MVLINRTLQKKKYNQIIFSWWVNRKGWRKERGIFRWVKETNRALKKPTVHERDWSADSGRILQRGPPILTRGIFFLCVSQMAPFQYSSLSLSFQLHVLAMLLFNFLYVNTNPTPPPLLLFYNKLINQSINPFFTW